ncbi:isochorismatase [Exiguobacterium sp. SH31]|uniref:isochorismatase family protein n=1 Tax=unclassified Exiguobacterium TaxID=2644629 RepID=UPI0008AF6998|nr:MULTISPECIES: isochorismatase family protein [unclassified Exiguobacterium]OGX79736.1 isochorismatase [Exiguobacterium sp. SH31]TCI71207.1 isochorismatase family protein [Exiguobacterium sp. SH0S7]
MKQALLVIDFQQELVDGNDVERGVERGPEVAAVINNLIQQASSKQVPVIFVRDLDVADGRGDGFAVHRSIIVPDDSVLFDKQATNAFHGTPLLSYLRTHAVQHLVITGAKTEHCIDTSVRTATVSGFDVTLVSDGHTTNGSDVLTPEQIIDHHNQVLHGHYNVEHFAIARPSTEDVFSPTHDTYR